jgi:hypothetical protein
MRDGAPRIGRTRRHYTRVDEQAVETARGYVSRPKYSLGIASRGAPGLGALPKNCHLLPSTAIMGRKIVATVSIVHFFTCPSRACRPAWAPG